MDKSAKSISWKALPWEEFKVRTLRLQYRIYKAMQRGDIEYVIKLQKLLINSSATHYIAVEEVTSLNIFNTISNTDNENVIKYTEKSELTKLIAKKINNWKHSPISKLVIVQKEGIRRQLAIPTIEDHIVQYIWKIALEAAHEAKFSEHNYGFRPGRTPWDLQQAIIMRLNQYAKPFSTKVLKIEIDSCFKNIDHNLLMKKLIFPHKNKIEIFRALKAGILKQDLFSEEGLTQNVMLSSLLGNIALDEIEVFHKSEKANTNTLKYKSGFFSGIRYGNKIVYILKEDENEKVLIEKFKQFLKERKLEFLNTKIEVIQTKNGFDLLGWHFVVKPTGQLVSYPNKRNWENYKKKFKFLLKSSRHTIQIRLDKLKVLTKKWHDYHQFCDMTQIKAQLYELKNWHTNYLRSHTKMSKEERILTLRHIFNNHFHEGDKYEKVPHTKSPFDGDLEYWSRRKSKIS